MRPGWKTTEFWLALGAKVLTVIGVALHIVPGGTAAAVLGGVAGVYTIGRAITKANQPGPDPTPAIKDAVGQVVGALGSLSSLGHDHDEGDGPTAVKT